MVTNPLFHTLCGRVKFLRTFHCARKWGNDFVDDDDASDLEGLLVTIAEVESEVEQAANRLSLDYKYFDEVDRRIDGFKQDINQWYIKFSDCSRQSSSSQKQDMTSDEILEFIDYSLLGCLDILFREYSLHDDLLDRLDSLKEKTIFLRNFIRFTTLHLGSIIITNDDDRRGYLGNLLTHIRAVAISAAHYSYMCQFGELIPNQIGMPVIFNKEMESEISHLLKKIKPVDPQDYKTCVQILENLSRQPSAKATLIRDENVSKDFITSLLSYLFEILKADRIPVFSFKDQLQILHDGLRSLRYILENQTEKFDENLWELTREVVCDAGIVIFSLFLDSIEDGLAKKMNRMTSDLLKRIKRITASVPVESLQGSIFNFAKVYELRFVDFLLENLAKLTNGEAASAAIPNLQIQTISEGLVFLRNCLAKILELHDQKEELQALWNRVVELAYKVECPVESLAIGDIADSSVTSFDSFDSIVEEMKIIQLDASEIFDEAGFDVESTKFAERSDHFSWERSIPIIKNEIVGFEDQKTSIKIQLERGGGSDLQILAIVGMAGSGKTTLAKMVYDDISINSSFHVCARCHISQDYDKIKVLGKLLTCLSKHPEDVKESFHAEHSTGKEDEWANMLRQKLMRNKYLIVLDDMWTIDAWNELEASFPNDKNGSRIILTSRNTEIAPKDKLNWKTHKLHLLTDDESSELLKKKLFPKTNWPVELSELRKQILQKCKGLPLSIVILTGILATVEQDGWKEIVEHLNSGKVSIVEKCEDILELSYRCLHDKLKLCFLYFGLFPEDQELTTKKLTWLWIAEGFVSETQSMSLEDEAKNYLMHLISRSLVMVDKQSSNGGVKTCRIHDLLHNFCVKKAKEEKFFQILKNYEELSCFNETHNVRRLHIRSEVNHLKETRIFCPRMGSLVLFSSQKWLQEVCLNPLLYIGNFKDVRVLDLSQFVYVRKYPFEIGLLVQLRYLELATWAVRSIPSSIDNLVNLETLIVETFFRTELPNSIWNLKKLRHLEIEGLAFAHFDLGVQNFDSPAQLYNLDTVSSIRFDLKYAEKILKKFPKLRKLKAEVYADASDEENDSNLALGCLEELESLNLTLDATLQVEFSFPKNLKKLTLAGTRLPWCKMSAIGNLSKLKVLKLHYLAFAGKTWNMDEARQFPSLKFLKLWDLDILEWTTTDSGQKHFPCLVKLVLQNCGNLQAVPSCLEDCPKLQMIEVYNCSSSIEDSLKRIQEEQKDMGNKDFKVRIHH